MMADSTETKTGESNRTMTQMRISEIVFGKISDRKLDENNYLQWKWVIDIYMAGREKTSYLSADPFIPVTNASTLDDNVLLHQILTTIEPKIQDLVLHCMIVKELWCFLKDLYEVSCNINRA